MPSELTSDQISALVEATYPALARQLQVFPDDAQVLARSVLRQGRDLRSLRRQAMALVGDITDLAAVRRGLRRFAAREKLRVAVRELLHLPGADVDVTARELSDLADVCAEVALGEARRWAEERFGVPVLVGPGGTVPCRFVVVGMGKLGGRELNAGSDVDLLLFYESDEGEVRKEGAATEISLHEHFTKVAQRFVATLDDNTEDGIVWRVDLRLRPEGSRGPLVNALAAAERYYETWGRTWERAALLRARPMAGDLEFGKELLGALGPFVWRREVNPAIAEEMAALLLRARVEIGGDAERDLKLGRGGIREAEFFVQSLQLVWGGREPVVRSTGTLDALRRLRARGLVTDREGREVADAYLLLRRLEHRVQFATGIQTHLLPDGELLQRIAKSLGYAGVVDLHRDLERTRRRVAARFASLRRGPGGSGEHVTAAASLGVLYGALDARDEAGVLAWLTTHLGMGVSPDLARHVFALARRPDHPLGAATRERHPQLLPVLLEALADAADPEQAMRLLAAFFARLLTPSVYAKALAEDPRAARRLASLLGASAFLGEALVNHPELLDPLLFGRGVPTPDSVGRVVEEELATARAREPEPLQPDDFVGALRRAQARVLMEVGLADLAGDLSTRQCTLALSALADAVLQQALTFALAERGLSSDQGLVVVAMGKLGGREVGYGSDLDVFFVYEDDGGDGGEVFVRVAQRVLRLVSMPHGDGPGYELDTRLRPSGNHGLLVVSRESFARYHHALPEGEGTRPDAVAAADWERQALLKARVCAGDEALAVRILGVAQEAAYGRGPPPPERVHHLRLRMERELARERPRRFDLKLGRGGLVDVEFAVQWLQMRHGADPRVRSTETEVALGALEACGYLPSALALTLRDGYRFLRRLEQRLRVLHGTSAQLLEEGAEGLVPLARRMGLRDGPRGSAAEALVAQYKSVTGEVRRAYLAVLGVAEGEDPPPGGQPA